VIHAQPTGQRPNLYPGRSGNMADPNQAGMPNRLMIRNLAGPATARCRIELDDLGMPTD